MRQQKRKLKELKTNVEKALWFAETFGLSLNSVIFSQERMAQTTCFPMKNLQKSPFNNLAEEEQDKLKRVLFALNKFCIGDAAYMSSQYALRGRICHGLTQTM